VKIITQKQIEKISAILDKSLELDKLVFDQINILNNRIKALEERLDYHEKLRGHGI
jgi:hypothetical protein